MNKGKKILALALAATMAFSAAVSAASFPDVDSTTPEGIAIAKLSEMGVLGGFEDGTFGPEKTVTRAQFAKIVYMLENQGTTDPNADAFKGESVFTDVAADKWFAGFVNWANKQGIVGGMGDGTFAPDATLTMAQAVKMYVTSKGVSAEGLEYPQGFIDIASESGYLLNVAEFKANDAAPRGTIALIGFNTLEGDPTPEPPVSEATFADKGIVTATEDGSVTVAKMNVTALPTKTDATQGKTYTQYSLSKGAEATLAIAADCKISLFEGDMNGDMSKPATGTAADLKISTDEEFYVVQIEVVKGEIKMMNIFKTPMGTLVKQYANGYLSMPAKMSIYAAKGSTTEIALGTYVQANSGVQGALVSFTQPSEGTITMAASGRPFRVDYTLPADKELKVGDSFTFTFTSQTSDGKKTSSGVVTLTMVQATTCPDMTLTVKAGETGKLTPDVLYKNVKYAPGAPFGKPAFLMFDEAKNTYFPSGTKVTTEAGAEATRKDGDIIEYKATAEKGTDTFKICLADGIGVIVVNVNVIIE